MERRLFVAVFAAAFVAHLWLVFFNLRTPFLPGHEFRQSQTALITYYIDKQSNFSPLYEQPILGKPWKAFILEFPLYQWSVVGLSRATGWEHFIAARIVSITCFYLTLPALYLLLGRLGLASPRRLLVLALVLMCPVYIFYTRAFLIDSMALMFSAWFVAGFVRTMDRRSVGWLGLTIVAGLCAALVKSFIYAIWLGPAAAYGASMLWRGVRARQGWRPPMFTTCWGLATVALPLGALKWWLAITDPLKEAHPSAYIFTSKNLSQGNWGLFKFNNLFSQEVWGTLMDRWSEAMMPPWLLLGLLAAGAIGLPQARMKALALASVFFLAQILFPFAYAYQDYYFFSCAVFATGALGVFALALWDRNIPRWVASSFLIVLIGAEVRTYWGNYRFHQALQSPGRLPFTESIQNITLPGSVLVLAGYDWAPMIPYYAERRALMIRNGLEYDTAYLTRAYGDLHDEYIGAVVVGGDVRKNQRFLQFTIKALDLDPVPVFSVPDRGDVYVPRLLAGSVVNWINGARNRFPSDTVFPSRAELPRRPMQVSSENARLSFAMVQPGPRQIDFEFGYATMPLDGHKVLSAHAESFLWLVPPPEARTIEMEFGIVDGAWNGAAGGKTNGVEFAIYATGAGGEATGRILYRRLLDPAVTEGDRGLQNVKFEYTAQPGETLCFAALSNGSKSYDWAYWRRIAVH